MYLQSVFRHLLQNSLKPAVNMVLIIRMGVDIIQEFHRAGRVG